MNLLETPAHKYTDYYDIARFRLAWRINTLLTIALFIISFFFLFNNIVTFFQYIAGFLIALTGVIFLYISRTYKTVSYIIVFTSLPLVIFSIVSVTDIPHLIEPLWLVIITIFAYFNLGKIVGNSVLIIVALFNGIYFYFLLNSNEPVKYIFTKTELIGLILEITTCFFILGYFIYNFIETTSNAELKLKENNHFLNAIFDHIPNLIYVKDAKNLELIKVNKTGEHFFHLKSTNIKRLNNVNSKIYFEKSIVSEHELLENKNTQNIPEEEFIVDNSLKWLHTQKIPILDDNGNALYLLVISEDITQRKKQDDKIYKLNSDLKLNIQRLKIVNKELEAFTYTVSHDLRSPLRSIDGYAQMMMEDYLEKLDEEGKRILTNIRTNATRMGKLIDDLLAFSRLGKKELKKTTIDMNDLVLSVLNELNANQPNNAKITIGKLHPSLGDYGLLHQVWFNLIANAIKFSSKKEKPLIEISSEETKNDITYTIKDNGVGFDSKYSNKLFKVFQRLHSQEEFSGTGVGLAIVFRIIDKHGGNIYAIGQIDEGATFRFSLPKNKSKRGL